MPRGLGGAEVIEQGFEVKRRQRAQFRRGPRNQKLRHFPSNGDFVQLALAMERLRPATASLGS